MAENAPYIDLAQIVLYLFWIFFACVIFYLLRENKREGYPLDTNRLSNRVQVQGWPGMPSPKTYKLAGGGEFTAPNNLRDTRPVAAEPMARHGGAPLVPTGNPMLDGVGPAAYAERADVPDLTTGGKPKIVPLRAATDYHVDSRDPDPRGLPVIGADGVVGGTVVDAWVDRSESLLRYLEVEVAGGGRRLLPVNFSRVSKRQVRVQAILGSQFKDVPALRSTEQVTLLEEDKVCAYYGGGTLYAEPSRQEPLL
jgi:photosynthetic reaction center H subunit